MKSEITAQLLGTLKSTQQLGIGLVRAPFLAFQGGGNYALWHLTREGKEVALVYPMSGGPRVRFSTQENGAIPLLDSIRLLWRRFIDYV